MKCLRHYYDVHGYSHHPGTSKQTNLNQFNAPRLDHTSRAFHFANASLIGYRDGEHLKGESELKAIVLQSSVGSAHNDSQKLLT